MSHVGEGEIQAYLDGAYDALSSDQLAEIERRLEQDPAFAELVEEERRIRDAASGILGEASPANLTPPPFEEIQRRAAARPSGQAGRRRWVGLPPMVGMSWAATVILALGVGWFVGQGAGTDGADVFLSGPQGARHPGHRRSGRISRGLQRRARPGCRRGGSVRGGRDRTDGGSRGPGAGGRCGGGQPAGAARVGRPCHTRSRCSRR